jgi:hypothetical protein
MLRMSAPSGDATSRRFGESLSFSRAQHSSAQRTHRWSSSASVFTPPDARGLASESAPFGPASQADDRRVLIAWPMIGAFRSADVAFTQSQDRGCTPRRRRSFRLCVSYRSGRRKRCHSDGKATALRELPRRCCVPHGPVCPLESGCVLVAAGRSYASHSTSRVTGRNSGAHMLAVRLAALRPRLGSARARRCVATTHRRDASSAPLRCGTPRRNGTRRTAMGRSAGYTSCSINRPLHCVPTAVPTQRSTRQSRAALQRA